MTMRLDSARLDAARRRRSATAARTSAFRSRGLFDWIDRTFPADDERAFVAPVRDVEMLARIGWEVPFPERLDEASVLNLEDLPDEIADGLTRPHERLVACAACRAPLRARRIRLERETALRLGSPRAGVRQTRTLARRRLRGAPLRDVPSCAYVATPLLDELGVEEVLALGAIEPRDGADTGQHVD